MSAKEPGKPGPGFMKLEVKKEARPPGEAASEAGVAAPSPPAAAPPAETESPFERTTLIRSALEGILPGPPQRLPLCERADLAAHAIRAALGAGAVPRIAVILGSGLGGFAESLDGAKAIPYEQVPGFPRPTVPGHAGRLVLGRKSGVPIAVLQGRFHTYEGYSAEEVTFPVRVLGRLGVRLLVVTNAAGGISEKLAPGDIMAIEDHINLTGLSPLVGPNDDRLGPRFPDMSEAYPERFRRAVLEAAPPGVPLKTGVYAATGGPQYETPAEIRMLRALGADAVGMSTVHETIVAAHMGIAVVGLSGIANMAAGIVRGARLTHAEVIETMKRAAGSFAALLARAVPALDELLA